MAGIDVNNSYPNSRMARAARLGQSRFVSNEGLVENGIFSVAGGAIDPATSFTPSPNGKTSLFTINTALTSTTANLLTDAGFATQFNSLSISVQASTAGVTVAQGSGSIVIKAAGTIVIPGPISVAANPVTITTAAGDVVNIEAQGI